jgi:hypothetical protein
MKCTPAGLRTTSRPAEEPRTIYPEIATKLTDLPLRIETIDREVKRVRSAKPFDAKEANGDGRWLLETELTARGLDDFGVHDLKILQDFKLPSFSEPTKLVFNRLIGPAWCRYSVTPVQTGGSNSRLRTSAGAPRPRGSKPKISSRKVATATCQPRLSTTADAASSRCRRADQTRPSPGFHGAGRSFAFCRRMATPRQALGGSPECRSSGGHVVRRNRDRRGASAARQSCGHSQSGA